MNKFYHGRRKRLTVNAKYYNRIYFVGVGGLSNIINVNSLETKYLFDLIDRYQNMHKKQNSYSLFSQSVKEFEKNNQKELKWGICHLT